MQEGVPLFITQGYRGLHPHARHLTNITITYVVVVDCDVTIPVWPAMFMPPAQGVEYLVHNNALVLTPITNGDILNTTNTTNVGVTPIGVKNNKCVAWLLLFVCKTEFYQYCLLL